MDSPKDPKQQSPKKQKGKLSKAKSIQGRKRYLLFEPSSKTELKKIFGGGLAPFFLEKEVAETVEEEEGVEELLLEGKEKDNSNSISLDFEESESEGSDDDDDELEDLPVDESKVTPSSDNSANGKGAANAKGVLCGSCKVAFTDIWEQRLHYTLDWHRYNLKRKLQGRAPVVEDAFDDMIDDLSSIDGSDDEGDDRLGEKQNRLMDKLVNVPTPKSPSKGQLKLSNAQKLENSPKLHFKNEEGQIVSCYKAILLPPGSERQEGEDTRVTQPSDLAKIIDQPLKITIIMVSGGHFAAAVFDGNSCTHHKTFHSYTVRAKQGGSQGSRDAKSGAGSHPKSAGASLRRYNEQSFSQHVQELLDSWKNDINKSDFIFHRAVSSNANILFSGKNPPLNRKSNNLKTIPFPTQRPTFNEVKRVHSLLTTIHVYESSEAFQAGHSHLRKNHRPASTSPSKTKKPVDRAKSRSPKRKEDTFDIPSSSDDETDNTRSELELVDHIVDFNDLKEYDDSINDDQKKENRSPKKKNKKAKSQPTFVLEGPLVELSAHVLKGDLDLAKNAYQTVKESNDPLDLNAPVSLEGFTLLHTAAKQNHVDVVWFLLEIGCDPASKDKSGKYPYNYADTRECRDTFRRFMGQYPEKYDYKKAQVPPPLSEEMEKERAEKKKLLNKLKREKEKQKKSERMEKDKETEEQRRFLSLSDREKRALAAEQRILANCKKNSEQAPVLVRCFDCAADITGKVPFEYNQNVFCTPKCLAAHRKKFPCPLSV